MTDEPGVPGPEPAAADPLSDFTIDEVLAAAAEDLVGVSSVSTPDAHATTWSVGPTPFAVLTGERAEFRLDPLVVAAALRTPDTASSPRGRDWIVFAPVILDDAAIDRVEAWFLSAHRRLAPKRVD
ncbi:MAG TPA: hypothetical protein VM427_00750 [Patescibacteria group bacterium]|nr:hypothetical protein [Patescibacteria group bacterium]